MALKTCVYRTLEIRRALAKKLMSEVVGHEGED
jgi:hypothetical protein